MVIEKILSQGNKVLIADEAINPEPAMIRVYGQDIVPFAYDMWQPYQDELSSQGQGINQIYILVDSQQ